jgi:hypothetical protein
MAAVGRIQPFDAAADFFYSQPATHRRPAEFAPQRPFALS